MRNIFLVLFVLGSAGIAFAGRLTPLSLKEVSLMLRSGYSNQAVEKELSSRHFMDPVDSEAEKLLMQAGATEAFVGKLKSGAFGLPPQEIATAQDEVAAQAKRRALQSEEARKLNTLYQSKLAEARAASTPVPGPAANAIAAMVKGDLVTSKNGILSVFNDQALEKKKFIALFFSAKWCPSCRKFTPELVEYYNRVAPAHPEFELIFVSTDRSAPAMEAHMRDAQMPWPAVNYEKLADKAALRGYAGSGIPCLVVVDANGKVLSDSYAGKTYLGPAKVLADLDRIFAGGTAGQVAQQP